MPRVSDSKKQKKFGVQLVVIILVVAAIFAGWYVYDRSMSAENPTEIEASN